MLSRQIWISITMQRKKLRQQGKLSFQPDGFLQLVLCRGRILPPLGRLRIIGSREPEAIVISSVFNFVGTYKSLQWRIFGRYCDFVLCRNLSSFRHLICIRGSIQLKLWLVFVYLHVKLFWVYDWEIQNHIWPPAHRSHHCPLQNLSPSP